MCVCGSVEFSLVFKVTDVSIKYKKWLELAKKKKDKKPCMKTRPSKAARRRPA